MVLAGLPVLGNPVKVYDDDPAAPGTFTTMVPLVPAKTLVAV